MSTVPDLLYRFPGMVDLKFNHVPGVSKFRLKAHTNLNDAYGSGGGVGGSGTDTLFEVTSGSNFFSPSVQKKRPQLPGTIKNATRVVFSGSDYSLPTNGIPLDDQIMFLRIQEFHVGSNAWLPEGPIKIIFPPRFTHVANPALTLSGSAPGVSGVRGNSPPNTSLRITFPFQARSFTITNLDGSNELLLSTGEFLPLHEIPANTDSFHIGGISEIFLCSSQNGTPVNFSLRLEMMTF